MKLFKRKKQDGHGGERTVRDAYPNANQEAIRRIEKSREELMEMLRTLKQL